MSVSSPDPPFLSLVVPAYNEAERLPQTLAQIADFVLAQPYAVEVLVVDNNSRDGTRAIAAAAAGRSSFLRVLEENRQGKGAAVRTGALAAGGEWIFFADADLSMPIEQVNRFLPPALEGHDVAIGSREVAGARRIGEPWRRHWMGRVFNAMVKRLAVEGFEDTQCGFKCFRREAARELFPAQTESGWAFDVELLHIARRRGLKIVEVPIDWYYRENSRVSPLRDSMQMARALMRIRRNGRNGLYD